MKELIIAHIVLNAFFLGRNYDDITWLGFIFLALFGVEYYLVISSIEFYKWLIPTLQIKSYWIIITKKGKWSKEDLHTVRWKIKWFEDRDNKTLANRHFIAIGKWILNKYTTTNQTS